MRVLTPAPGGYVPSGSPTYEPTPTPNPTTATVTQSPQSTPKPTQSSHPTQPTVIKTTKTTATITKKSAGKLANKGLSLQIITPIATIKLCDKALSAIAEQADGDIQFNAAYADTSALSDEQQTAIGDTPVYGFAITSGGKTISQNIRCFLRRQHSPIRRRIGRRITYATPRHVRYCAE